MADEKWSRDYRSKGYGSANRETGAPFDPHETVVRIGSISKLFVATAVMQLVEQGKLDLDELRALRGDLDAIVLQALHGDTARRYRSVRELVMERMALTVGSRWSGPWPITLKR